MTDAPTGHDLTQLRFGWPERSLLAQLPDEALDALIHAGRVRRFAAKEILIKEGSRDRHAFLLLSGCVKVASRQLNGTDTLLAVQVGGDIVGELATLDGSPRSATVTACGKLPAIVCQVAGPIFTEVLGRFPEAMTALTTSISGKLRSATRRRIDLSRTAPVRLARVLVELVEDYGHRLSDTGHVIMVNLTQVELGTLIGPTEPTAHRALRNLRHQGLVDTGGQRLVVTALDQLRAFAERSAENPVM
jgi:CRP/FNR family transcriptional regulator, cyclic AMP receptor protein